MRRTIETIKDNNFYQLYCRRARQPGDVVWFVETWHGASGNPYRFKSTKRSCYQCLGCVSRFRIFLSQLPARPFDRMPAITASTTTRRLIARQRNLIEQSATTRPLCRTRKRSSGIHVVDDKQPVCPEGSSRSQVRDAPEWPFFGVRYSHCRL